MDFDKEMEAALIADGEKLRTLTGEDHGPWFMDDYGQMIPDTDHLRAELSTLSEQLATARAALGRISRWHGEFPPTGQFWENSDGTVSDRPMSYGAQHGSNGERDFMREIADTALDATS